MLTVLADDLDFIAYPGYFNLVAAKIIDMLTGKKEVLFAPDEVTQAAG